MPITHEVPAFTGSLWTATAKERATFPALPGDAQADICIIGGGITGLSTALHAAQTGKSVMLLEALRPGWGASGRNGGQVLPGLKLLPEEVEARFGDMGRRMIEASGAGPQLVFSLIAQHSIDCGPDRAGWISAALPAGLSEVRERARQWRTRGADVRDLDAVQTREMLGGGSYAGGLWDLRAGGINPQDYAMGLARAARAAGARIHGDSPAHKLTRQPGGWRIDADKGQVQAAQVAICTNGYSGKLHDDTRRSVVPVRSIQIATDPLPHDLQLDILPRGQVVSDTQKHLLYYRRDPEGRFLIGGAGAYTQAGLSIAFGMLHTRALDLFPQLKGYAWPHAWGGFLALTRDHLPQLAEPAEGLHVALGFNGRGVAMATVMGRVLAERLAGRPAAELDFPVRALRPFPLHRFHRQGVGLMLLLSALQDRMARD